MGKRGSGQGASGGPKKKLSKENIKDGDAGVPVSPDIKATFVVNPWLSKVLERFDAEWKQHQDIEELSWSKFLSDTFPAEADVEYLSENGCEDTACRTYLRPFMLSWKREAGNKGYVMQESFRNLMQLILAKGFETSSDIPGVELPVCSRHHEKLIAGTQMHMPTIEDDCLGANTISMIKGWSRTCAMHLVLKLCTELGILDQYLKYLGGKASGFSTIHANFRPCKDSGNQDIIDMNRGRSRASSF